MKMITRIASAVYSLLLTIVLELQTLFEFKSLVRLVLLFAFSAWSGVGVDAQETIRPGEANFLPPATGEALTLTPTDMPDVSCRLWSGKVSQLYRRRL